MKPALLTLLILIGSRLRAQDACPCVHKLDTLIDMISRDYAGYYDKVLADRTRYNTFADSLRKKAPAAVEEQACTELREAYCAFFKDKRLMVVGTPGMWAKGNIPDPKPSTTGWTADSLRSYFDLCAADLQAMEGVWKFARGPHELGLVYLDAAERYEAVTMRTPFSNWKEGMVKFNLTIVGPDSARLDYWRADMKFGQFKVFRSDGHLSLGEMGVLHRTIPAHSDTLADTAFELAHGNEVQWRMVDDSTLYIKVGSCQQQNQVMLDSLVTANAAVLDRIPAWIIDVRRNWAGQDDVFGSLMPYLSTRPYQDPGVKYWMSPANTALLRTWLEEGRQDRTRAVQRSYDRWIKYAEKHPNTWSGSGYRTFKSDSTKSVPRRIAILTDTATAGYAELFLIDARGLSDKIIIVGQTTAGEVDYGHVIQRSLGQDDVRLSIPVIRRNWLGEGVSYNRTGVAPDVPLPPGTTDPIAFVRAWWAAH